MVKIPRTRFFPLLRCLRFLVTFSLTTIFFFVLVDRNCNGERVNGCMALPSLACLYAELLHSYSNPQSPSVTHTAYHVVPGACAPLSSTNKGAVPQPFS